MVSYDDNGKGTRLWESTTGTTFSEIGLRPQLAYCNLLASHNGVMFANTNYPSSFMSPDGGFTFVPISLPAGTQQPRSVVFCGDRWALLVLGGQSGLYTTQDWVNYTRITSVSGNGPIYNAKEAGIITCAHPPAFSLDGGVTWDTTAYGLITSPKHLIADTSVPTGKFYAIGGNSGGIAIVEVGVRSIPGNFVVPNDDPNGWIKAK